MITLKRLRVHNFFKLHDVDIELGPNIYLITGENQDEVSSLSNGAGKSLLCQSIVWCLFEELLRKGVKVDDVVGKSSEWTSVVIELTRGGQDVIIERYRKHPEYGNKVRLFVDGLEETLHSETTSKIESFLGISAKTIYHCSYSDSEKPPIVAMTPAEVKKTVSEILNTQRFDDYIKQIAKESSSVYTEKEAKSAVLNKLGEQLEEAMSKKEKLILELAEFEKNRAASIKELELERMSVKADALDTELILKEESQLKSRKEELEPAQSLIGKLNKSLKSNQASLREATELLTKMQALLVKQHAEIDSKKEARANIENNPSGVCSYCGNSLSTSKHTLDILKKIQQEIDEVTVRITGTTQKVNELKSLKNGIETKIASTEDSLAECRKSMVEYQEISDRLTQIARLFLTQEVTQNRIAKLNSKIESLSQQTPPSEHLVDYLTSQIVNTTDSRAKIWEEITELNTQHSDLAVLKDAVTQVKVGLFNNFIYSLHAKIEDYLEEMTGGDFQVSIKESKNELSFLFSQPSKEGVFYPYSVFSKGEKARLRKAVQMAIEDLMHVGFLIDDEGLDGVDDAGIPMILDFMLSKSVGKTVFIVGHQQILKDYFSGYPNIHVSKKNDVATVEMRLV